MAVLVVLLHRAFTSVRSELGDGDAVAEDLHQINLFLASPVYSKNLIFHNLRTEVKKVPGSEPILIYMLELAQVHRWVLKEVKPVQKPCMIHRALMFSFSAFYFSESAGIGQIHVAGGEVHADSVTSSFDVAHRWRLSGQERSHRAFQGKIFC